MGKMSLKVLYKKNERFKEYVDRYAESLCISVKDALQHSVVRSYGDYCAELSEYGDEVSMEWAIMVLNTEKKLKESQRQYCGLDRKE